MINVNQITSQLARMPDQALQQYAQMHKGDPYVLSLALAESNRRKQMRQGAQMNAPEQPKVADQAIQGMAAPMPESVGIGQLPAGNMNFADGGIVAFGSGGDVPGYADEGLVRYPGLIQYGANYPDQPGTAGPLLGGKTGYEGMGPGELVQAIYEDLKKKIGPGLSPPERAKAEREAQRQANMLAATQRNSYTPAQYGVTTPAPLYPGARDYSKTESTVADPGAVQQVVGQQTAAAPKADTGAAGARGPGQRVPPAGGPGPGPGSGATQTPGLTAGAPNLDAAAMMEAALKKAEGVKHPYEQELGAIGQAKVKAKEEEVTGLEAIQKQFADIYKGRKERLDTKEAELEKLKDQGMGLALLQAGAAMMTTPGAFGTALGKGVKVGTEQYAAGLDKLQAAKDKLSDARDRLEEIEAQRGELSARELFKARNAVKDVNIGAREDLIKANMQMYGLKREEALKVVEQQLKVGLSQFEQGEATKRSMFEQGEATKRTQISAGAQLGLLRAIANDPKLQAVYGKGPKDKLMDEYTDFVKANPQYLANESAGLQAFLRAKGALSALGGAGAAGSVSSAPTGKVLQ